VAAVANATVPLFVVLLAIKIRPSERATGARLAGIVLGLVGVVVLAGAQPGGGWWAVAGTLGVVLASLSYASGALYGQARSGELAGPVLAAGTVVGAAIVLAPFAAFQLPGHMPGWKAIASILALGILGTALAQLLLFRMFRLYGASRTTLVTYLMPPAALFYGAVFLDEPLTIASVGGLVIILAGVALGSGAVTLARRRRAPAAA
jgi:drug/metabolite transporter (DMT)-like permease